MSVGNGKDHDAEVVGPCEGSEVLRWQLAQLAALHDQHTARVAFEAQRQTAIAQHKAELERATEDFKAAMASSDYAKVADAARRISRCEVRLMHLGAYQNGK